MENLVERGKESKIKVLQLLCILKYYEYFMFIKNKMLILMFLISIVLYTFRVIFSC